MIATFKIGFCNESFIFIVNIYVFGESLILRDLVTGNIIDSFVKKNSLLRYFIPFKSKDMSG